MQQLRTRADDLTLEDVPPVFFAIIGDKQQGLGGRSSVLEHLPPNYEVSVLSDTALTPVPEARRNILFVTRLRQGIELLEIRVCVWEPNPLVVDLTQPIP